MPNPQSGRRDTDEQRAEREAHYFRLICGAMCVAFITFGLLNAMNVIHV